MLARWCLLNYSNCYSFFWLRARRRRRIRAKRRLSSWDHAFTASASLRWRSTARTTAVLCAHLLEGSRINRQLWVRPRSSSFYQDTVQGWSAAEFKGNFRMSRPTFAYLVSKLKPTLERQDFLRSSIRADQRFAITLWRLGANIEYRTISYLFGVGLFTVCMLVHQVCQAIVAFSLSRHCFLLRLKPRVARAAAIFWNTELFWYAPLN